MTRLREGLSDHLRSRYAVTEFIGDEIPDVYAMSDIVLSRSGAGTVAEVTALGKVAVMIPLPGTGGDEQVKNASTLASRGAAVVIHQPEANPDRVLHEIERLLDDPDARAEISRNASVMGKRDAASRLVDELLEMVGR
jgi:UDP-N-acetylglucosamine--N-acetylmuramyl-(pentapeptide) pyrophosphoryl-undecaprenol N-acetylglucosamine transferase